MKMVGNDWENHLNGPNSSKSLPNCPKMSKVLPKCPKIPTCSSRFSFQLKTLGEMCLWPPSDLTFFFLLVES